jgi:hypothetical protein
MMTSPPPLSREEADRILVGLGAVHDQVAAAMYNVDSHPGLAFLRGGALSGATAVLWRELGPRIERMWAHFTIFSEVLDQSRSVRDRRGRPGDAELAELGLLLRAATIGLDGSGLPSDGTAGAPDRFTSVDELVLALRQSCTEVLAQLTAVDTAVGALTARFEPLERTLTEARELATTLDQAATEPGNEVVARLARARTELLYSDPVGAAPAGVPAPATEQRLAGLRTELSAAKERLTAQAALREGFTDRFAALGQTIDEVATAERQAADAYRAIEGKILNPGLPVPPDGAARLRTAADGLHAVHAAAMWAVLGNRFAKLERDVADCAGRARRFRDAADGLLGRRDELRGRLDAYHAKAGRHGLAEHAGLTAQHQTARDLLFTAPCDLPAATRAVFGYQQLLAELLDQPTTGTQE